MNGASSAAASLASLDRKLRYFSLEKLMVGRSIRLEPHCELRFEVSFDKKIELSVNYSTINGGFIQLVSTICLQPIKEPETKDTDSIL